MTRLLVLPPDGLDPVTTRAITELGNNQLSVNLASPLFRFTESQTDAQEISSLNTKPIPLQEISWLSLSGLLQLLFDRVGFNCWHPSMEGKRDWYVIRKFLLQEANHIFVKGEVLAEHLFIPRTFNKQNADCLANKRDEWLNRVCRQEDSKRQMGIIVGQIRDLQDAKYGGRLIIRHLPKFPFWIPEELFKDISNRYFRELAELEATDQPSRNRLMAIMIIERRPSGSYAVNDMAIMRTNYHWLPIWSRFGGQLADKLIADKRQFMKPMRFDAARSTATPCFLLLDTGSQPFPLYVPVPGEDKTVHQAVRKQIESLQDAKQAVWVWEAIGSGFGQIPVLPESVA